MSAIGRRYARAAVAVAEEKGGMKGVDALAQGVTVFLAVYRESSELREVLRNPALRDARGPSLKVVAQRVGMNEQATRLVLLLAERDRFEILEDVVAETAAIADERVGRARAYVTTPIALSEAQAQRLSRALEKRFGKPVALSVATDPRLIGGMVCRVGDVTMDSSVRRQLESMRERLLA